MRFWYCSWLLCYVFPVGAAEPVDPAHAEKMARSRDPAGVGYGIFLYDFARAARGR